ncbi:MAG: hypothetical protein ACLURV_03545 [Gallintestinimicrobium sp.]
MVKKEFEAYIEDLALFGANAIELLPPKTDDRLYSALFPEDPMELMCEVSKIIHSYGMDVWLWYPNVGRDYHDFGCIDREMEERRRVFSAIPYLDAMLVPLGSRFPLADGCDASDRAFCGNSARISSGSGRMGCTAAFSAGAWLVRYFL